jgi:hypothetical protein
MSLPDFIVGSIRGLLHNRFKTFPPASTALAKSGAAEKILPALMDPNNIALVVIQVKIP